MIRTVVVDDEQFCLETIKELLHIHCPQIDIVDTARSVKEGVKSMNMHKPDLLFLDINMPDGDGFDLLEMIPEKTFEVVFTTVYNQYALRAIEFSALHYLLKPIGIEELIEAVSRYEKRKSDIAIDEKLQVLQNNYNGHIGKIIIPTFEGLQVVEVEEIIRCVSEQNYTTIFLNDGKQIVVSKPINNFESLLSESYFSRVHRTELVNLKYVKRFVKGRGGHIILRDGTTIAVSTRKKQEFLDLLSEYAKSVK